MTQEFNLSEKEHNYNNALVYSYVDVKEFIRLLKDKVNNSTTFFNIRGENYPNNEHTKKEWIIEFIDKLAGQDLI
jgi:hypothetical protein